MHRTQLLLEDKQYELLKQRATEEGKSLSRLLREIIDQVLDGKKKRHSFRELAGIAKGPGGFSGRDHDKILYRHPHR